MKLLSEKKLVDDTINYLQLKIYCNGLNPCCDVNHKKVLF